MDDTNIWVRGEYLISTDRALLDLRVIHEVLSTSYWAEGRSLTVVKRSIEHSLPFGVYKQKKQVGFARVVTDYATFAWIADVFIIDSERGHGLSKWLMERILSHPELQGLRRWILATKDAHGLYKQFGFNELRRPERFMERPGADLREQPDYWREVRKE